jgi:hypothetical protein
MKKISLLLTVLMLMGLFTACGGPANKNPGITSVDLQDSGAAQQRWLSMPGSKLVINPDAFSTGTDNSDLLRVPLNIGIMNIEGETPVVDKTINNLMFLMETNASNGVGGTVLFTGHWGDSMNFTYNKNELAVEPEGDNKVKYYVTDTSANAWAGMTMKQFVECNFDKDVFLNVSVPECVGMFSLKGTIEAQADVRKTGALSYNLTEISKFTGKKKIQFTMYAIEKNNPVTFDLFEIKEIDKGNHFATEKATSTWAPYAITYNIKYPNGAAFEVTDFFADEQTIVRKLRCVAAGAMVLGGEYNGTATYDSKTGYVQVEGDGFKYVVAPKRKLNPKFYANEADMLAVANGTDAPAGTTGFWTIGLSNFAVDDELYMAVSMDTEKSLEDLGAQVKDKINTTKAAAFYTDRITFWDTYLVDNAIPSTYIKNAPAAKAE